MEVTLEGEIFKNVDKFRYLRSTITENGELEEIELERKFNIE